MLQSAGRMNKEQSRRKRAVAASRRETWMAWTISGMALVATCAWLTVLMTWD